MPKKYVADTEYSSKLRSHKTTEDTPSSMTESRKGHFLLQVILLLLVCLRLGMGIVQRLNYGAIFVRKGDVVFTTEHWKHTYLIDINMQKPNLSFHVNCSDCDYLKRMFPHLADVYYSAIHEIEGILNHVNIIIPEHFPKRKRSKRSLLPFVGNIGKSLFGLATIKDVENVAHHVNSVIQKTNYLTNAFVKTDEILTSFMKSNDERLSNAFKTIEWNHNLIRNLTLQLNETFQLNEQQHTVLMAFMKMRLYTERLKQSYNKILIGCNDLIEGRLSEVLLPYHILAYSIHNISTSIRHHGYKLFSTDPLFYYKYGQFQYSRFNNTLYITVKFPMVVPSAELQWYEILTYPVPINSTSVHVSKISNVPKFLGIAQNNQYYAELDSSAIVNCKTFHSKTLCSYNLALTPTDYKQCSLSLFEGNKSDIQSHCDFHFMPNSLMPSIRQLNETHFMIFNTSKLLLDCPSRLKEIKGCHFCLMTIPCNCSISSENSFIPQRLTKCHHHSIPVTILYPVNLALLQQFFNNDVLKNIQAHSSFSDVVNVTVPKFNIFEHKYTESIATERYEHLNLKKMVAIAKKNKVIYTSVAEPLLQNYDNTYTIFPTELLLAIISTTVSILSIFGIVVLFLKFRKLSIMYTSLHNKVEAMIPSFHYTTTTQSSPHDDTTAIPFELTTAHIILIITGVIALYKLFRYWCRKQKLNTLIIEFTNGQQCVQIPISKLPMCMQQCKFVGTNVLTEVTIKYKFWPTVHLNFGDLRVIDKLSNKDLALLKSIKINPFKAFQLQRIVKSKFTTCLWIHQGAIGIPIDLGYPQLQTTLEDEQTGQLLP